MWRRKSNTCLEIFEIERDRENLEELKFYYELNLPLQWKWKNLYTDIETLITISTKIPDLTNSHYNIKPDTRN